MNSCGVRSLAAHRPRIAGIDESDSDSPQVAVGLPKFLGEPHDKSLRGIVRNEVASEPARDVFCGRRMPREACQYVPSRPR